MIILATMLTAVYAVVLGLTHMFLASIDVSAEFASAFVPFTWPAFAVFPIVFAIGALAQFQIRTVHGRYVNR